MNIPAKHLPITLADAVYDLSHVSAFSTAIPGKGIEDGTDLEIFVVFSNHVYTERTKYGEPHHVLDHHGNRRTFDADRYEMSKTLGDAIRRCVSGNSLTHVSKSYGGMDNLIFLETGDGRKWAVVYCLEPIGDGRSVRMEILSCHPKIIDQKSISRRNLSYFARMCLHQNTRTPKA